MNRCDDCDKTYGGAPYYTFDPDDCTADCDPHLDCTGNICPRCAGPYLEPDQPGDPRRPKAPAKAPSSEERS
jgi:hypothetical protein